MPVPLGIPLRRLLSPRPIAASRLPRVLRKRTEELDIAEVPPNDHMVRGRLRCELHKNHAHLFDDAAATDCLVLN